MNKQVKKIEKIGARQRKNGDTYLFSGKADREQIMKFCNILADKIDEIVEFTNQKEKQNEN